MPTSAASHEEGNLISKLD